LEDWSFGDYFKVGAIDMAFELLTEVRINQKIIFETTKK
jgi:alanyl-tRNA synthetase